MSKKRNNCVAVMFTCLCLAGVAVAADKLLGIAASDPQQVPAIVAEMEAKDVPAFAGQTMQAVATMPTSPRHRLRQLKDVSVAFAQAVAMPETPALLAQLVMNTPFQMLPGWVDAFKPPLAELLKPLDDAVYDKLSAAVLKHIEDAASLTSEEKTIFVTFGVVLLARGETAESNMEFANRLLLQLPVAYRDQVAAATPAALAGDYTLRLGPDVAEFRLVEPMGKRGERTVNMIEMLGPVAKQPDLLVHDVNRPAPLARRDIADREEAVGPAPASPPKPVVPEPYKGQF